MTSHEVVDETIFIIFMELNRFDKALDDCRSMVDKWCYALRHVGTLDSLPEAASIVISSEAAAESRDL